MRMGTSLVLNLGVSTPIGGDSITSLPGTELANVDVVNEDEEMDAVLASAVGVHAYGNSQQQEQQQQQQQQHPLQATLQKIESDSVVTSSASRPPPPASAPPKPPPGNPNRNRIL